MKRVKLVLAAAAAMAALAVAGPASADDLELDDLDDGFFIVADDDDLGDVGLGVDQEADSGDVDLSFEVSNEGDYAHQSTPALQFANTGNFQDASGFVQHGSEADDFESGGIEFSIAPTLDSESNQTIRQSSAAGR